MSAREMIRLHVGRELLVIEAPGRGHRLRQSLAGRIAEWAPGEAERVNLKGRRLFLITFEEFGGAREFRCESRGEILAHDQAVRHGAELDLDRRHQQANHRAAHYLRRQPCLVGGADDADVVRRIGADIDYIRIAGPHRAHHRREIGCARRIALVIDDLEAVLLDFLAGAVGGALGELGVGGEHRDGLWLGFLYRRRKPRPFARLRPCAIFRLPLEPPARPDYIDGFQSRQLRRAAMARRPRRKPAAVSAASGGESGSTSEPKSERKRIIDSFMGLLAEKPMEEIGFAEIARSAGLSLAELRGMFGSTFAILAAHVKEIDRQVLADGDADMAEESPRERLFDVLMRRIETLEPRKAAVRSLIRSSRRNPGLAFALNGLAIRSQQWMLSAADIDASGPRGMVRAQGLALLFASVLRVWVHDDDPGHARTMATLDRALARGQRWSGFLDDLCRVPRCIGARRRRRRDADDADEQAVAV
jgi:AcrR family transcriptional regulator